MDVLKDAAEWLGVGAMLLVLGLCVLGLFAETYRDNWLQFAGLWLVVLALGLRLAWLCERWRATGELRLSWALIALQVGLAVYAVGTACKVVQFHRGARRPHKPHA